MKKKIHSSLDLSKLLSNFKEKVTKLLEIKSESEWSAQTFKDREEEIRNTALSLAGECVAVLLNKLSQSQSALDTAISQTKSWSNQALRKHGNYQRHILLPTGNVLKEQRVVIAVDGGRTRIRMNKKGRRKLKTNRSDFTGEWVEPKLLTIGT